MTRAKATNRRASRRRPRTTHANDDGYGWGQSWAKVGVLIGGLVAAATAGGWQVGGAVQGGAEQVGRRIDAVVVRLDAIERRLRELEQVMPPAR